MVKVKTFKTDGSNTSGIATDSATGLSFWQPLRDIRIIDLSQPSCGTRANDADWKIYANGLETDYFFLAEELDPEVKAGRSVVAPDGIVVKAGTKLQFKWSGQASAAVNYLKIYYVEL